MKILKSIAANTLLVITSIIICLILLEIILRFTPYKNIKRSYGYPQYHFQADEELGYDIAKNIKDGTHYLPDHPYKVFSNEYGCFDYTREVPENYGVIVGDSQTWGYTPLEKKWTTYLEAKSNVFMMKCGVTGYGTKQELIKAKRVINQVGHSPKYITVLYNGNDLNDDLAAPQRTVISGYLIGKVREIDLSNGKISYYSEEDLLKRKQKYLSNSFSGYLRRFRYSTVLYNVYMIKMKSTVRQIFSSKDKDESSVHSAQDNKPKKILTTRQEFPINGKITGFYGTNLMSFADHYDVEWYNELITDHRQNIQNFIEYSNSIGAKLLFVDLRGNLDDKRFQDLFSQEGVYYYNLTKDYPTSEESTWKYDGHWDIKGNQEGGEHIYRHYKKIGIFK
jgi:hypothetical protein